MTSPGMFLRNCVSACLLFFCFHGAAQAQSFSGVTTIPLTVDEGFPLQLVLLEKVSYKENAPVRAKIAEPVYAFDRAVVPSGSEVRGRITGFRKAGKWTSLFHKLRGDFTPVREPMITFDRLVLPNGALIPIETLVMPGTAEIVRLDDRNKGAHGSLKSALTPVVKPDRSDRVTSWLWGMSPYRPQSLPAGTRLQAVLTSTLDFGLAVLTDAALEELGSQPPSGSIASVRLVTSVDSRTSRPGTPLEGLLTRPIFSSRNRVVFPAGSRLQGEVMDATAARKGHRHGELAFRFTTIATPLPFSTETVATQRVDGNLVGVRVARGLHNLRINEDGETSISESKKRFIAPAYALAKVSTGMNTTGDPLNRAVAGAYGSKITKRIMGSDLSLGVPASIAGAMIPPVGIGMGVFSAARSVYSNFIGRGQDIHFPAHSFLEIRLDPAAEQ